MAEYRDTYKNSLADDFVLEDQMGVLHLENNQHKTSGECENSGQDNYENTRGRVTPCNHKLGAENVSSRGEEASVWELGGWNNVGSRDEKASGGELTSQVNIGSRGGKVSEEELWLMLDNSHVEVPRGGDSLYKDTWRDQKSMMWSKPVKGAQPPLKIEIHSREFPSHNQQEGEQYYTNNISCKSSSSKSTCSSNRPSQLRSSYENYSHFMTPGVPGGSTPFSNHVGNYRTLKSGNSTTGYRTSCHEEQRGTHCEGYSQNLASNFMSSGDPERHGETQNITQRICSTPISKWKIEKFDGNADKLPRFLAHVKEYALAEGVSESELLRNKIHLFSHDAADFVALSSCQSWSDLIEEIKVFALGSHSDSHILRYIARKRQGSESVAIFMSRMELLFRSLEGVLPEADQIEIITQGFRKEIGCAVAGYSITSVQQLKMVAQRVERLLPQQNHSIITPSEPSGYCSHSSGESKGSSGVPWEQTFM